MLPTKVLERVVLLLGLGVLDILATIVLGTHFCVRNSKEVEIREQKHQQEVAQSTNTMGY